MLYIAEPFQRKTSPISLNKTVEEVRNLNHQKGPSF